MDEIARRLAPVIEEHGRDAVALYIGNPAAQYCVDAYQSYTKRTLDTFDNDAEIRYLLEVCSALTIVRKAIELAGPNLTEQTFLQGMYSLHGLQTGSWPSVVDMKCETS